MHHKLWIGGHAKFPEEVDALLAVLKSCVIPGKASLVLSPERRDSFDWICDSPWAEHAGELDGGGWIALQTSGTTGEPKWVNKRFETILAQKRGTGSARDTWLLCYNPARWAGISVLAHVIRNSAALVVPRSLEPRDILAAMGSATHVSLTPSMFRKLLLNSGSELSAMPIRQLTFGGEYASQKILDDAQTVWPAARITHVYASTELGDICAVSDGMEGLPAEQLRHCDLTREGELVIGGHATGDMWEYRGNRLVFLGRREEIINVGGAKVIPSLVEAACLSVPGVLECRAYAVKNALLGEVVGLDYVGAVEPGELRNFLVSAVAKHAVPARIVKVDALPLTSAGKTPRGS